MDKKTHSVAIKIEITNGQIISCDCMPCERSTVFDKSVPGNILPMPGILPDKLRMIKPQKERSAVTAVLRAIVLANTVTLSNVNINKLYAAIPIIKSFNLPA